MESRSEAYFKNESARAKENIREFIKTHKMQVVEYELVGSQRQYGILTPNWYTHEQIKKAIKGQVKHHGGRWLGKYSIATPEKQEEVIKMMENYLYGKK